MIYHSALRLITISTILSCSSLSFALVAAPAECTSDADCGEGFECDLGGTTAPGSPAAPPCVDGDEASCEPQTEPAPVEESGFCIAVEEQCQSDADCGEYSTCKASAQPCSVSSDGTSNCPDPDPNAPKYCEPLAAASCEVDADCPREFVCQTQDQFCNDIGCLEGDSDCEDRLRSCQESTGGVCLPPTIDCGSGAECPSEWSCVTVEAFNCDGDGDSPSGAVAPHPGDSDSPQGDPDIACEIVESSFCKPPGWDNDDVAEQGGQTAASGPTSGPENPQGEAPQEGASQGGGCSLGQGTSGGGGWAWLMLLSAPLFLRRRKNA